MATKPTYTVEFVIDEDARFEECNGESRPLTETEYADNPYMHDGQPIPYPEYLRYYGNPDRHVYLGCVVHKVCSCCGLSKPIESLWNIDTMDDSQRPRLNVKLSPDEAVALPDYMGDIAREVLVEAGWTEASQ